MKTYQLTAREYRAVHLALGNYWSTGAYWHTGHRLLAPFTPLGRVIAALLCCGRVTP